jgi:hypothetical protein
MCPELKFKNGKKIDGITFEKELTKRKPKVTAGPGSQKLKGGKRKPSKKSKR